VPGTVLSATGELTIPPSLVAAPAAETIPSPQEVPVLPPWATAHRSAPPEEPTRSPTEIQPSWAAITGSDRPIPVKALPGVWTILMEQASLTSWEEPAAQAPRVSPPPVDDGPLRLDD
jgi:hypothetical protein